MILKDNVDVTKNFSVEEKAEINSELNKRNLLIEASEKAEKQLK